MSIPYLIGLIEESPLLLTRSKNNKSTQSVEAKDATIGVKDVPGINDLFNENKTLVNTGLIPKHLMINGA